MALTSAPSRLAPYRTAFNLATEYTEITEKTIKRFRVFRVFRGYLHDISLSKCHWTLTPVSGKSAILIYVAL